MDQVWSPLSLLCQMLTSLFLLTSSCKNCQYQSDCCCSPNQAPARQTVFVTKTIATRTATITKSITHYASQTMTLTATVKKARFQRRNAQESNSESTSPELVARAGSSAEAHHLCPVCPSGVQLGKNNGGGAETKYCCPRRKTIKIFKTKTHKVVATMTKTIHGTAQQILSRRIYVDKNGNGVYDPGEEVANTTGTVYLVPPGQKVGARDLSASNRHVPLGCHSATLRPTNSANSLSALYGSLNLAPSTSFLKSME